MEYQARNDPWVKPRQKIQVKWRSIRHQKRITAGENKIAKIWEEAILEETTTWKNLEKKLNERGIYFNRFNAENKAIYISY